MPPNPPVRNLKELVQWLANEYHGGVISRIQGKKGQLKLCAATMDKYVKGRTQRPTIDSLDALARAYDLDPQFVRGLVYPPLKEVSGGSDNVADNVPQVPKNAPSSTVEGALCKVRAWFALRITHFQRKPCVPLVA